MTPPVPAAVPNPASDDRAFGPSAELRQLRLRAGLLEFTRAFFRSRGLWEVETPLLSRDIVVDAYLEPFVTGSDCRPAAREHELFLQTSPEFAMKRLLAAGASDIFQLTHSFRRGEVGRLHNPEFTILEWYHKGATYHDEMTFVEDFVAAFWDEAARLIAAHTASTRPAPVPPARPFPRLTYDELFQSVLGTSVLNQSTAQLGELARACGIEPPPGLADDDHDGWAELLVHSTDGASAHFTLELYTDLGLVPTKTSFQRELASPESCVEQR